MTDREIIREDTDCAEKRQYPVTALEQGSDMEVTEVLPISVNAEQGVRTHLPSASAVRTRDGRILARFLEWDGGLERVWDQPGLYQVQGRLRDSRIPAVCWVQVRETDFVREDALAFRHKENGGHVLARAGRETYRYMETDGYEHDRPSGS